MADPFRLRNEVETIFMARSPGGSSVLLPIAIVAVVVVAILVGVFALGNDAPPDQATIISEDVNAEPAGAGTAAEAPADPEEDGVTDQLDEVEPAAEGEETIPAAEAQSGEAPSEPETDGSSEPDDAGGDAPDAAPAATLQDDATNDYLLDEESDAPEGATVDRAEEDAAPALPEGRDAQTELTPSECQDIVRDTDDGGAAVIPTPSGPNGNTGECVDSAQ